MDLKHYQQLIIPDATSQTLLVLFPCVSQFVHSSSCPYRPSCPCCPSCPSCPSCPYRPPYLSLSFF